MVQHGDKEPFAGDPGLTEVGRRKSQATAEWLRSAQGVTRVVTSPMLRAVETARPIAEALELDEATDGRLRERMNWEGQEQTLDEFLSEWRRASMDRSFTPQCGDSSGEAADRFLAVLTELATTGDEGDIAVVAHGGVTVDAIRTVLGDETLLSQQPALIDEGVPPCAITVFNYTHGEWVVELPSTQHLPAYRQPVSHFCRSSTRRAGIAGQCVPPRRLWRGCAPIQSRWFTTLRMLPSGARTRNRVTPQDSVVSGWTIS